jgi:hypothetical protein
MMKRKIMIAVCCALILCALTGCQLAKESTGANTNEDRLIGVLITMEHLDLFDFEGYLNDNLNSFQGGEMNMEGSDTQKYQGRLNAVLAPRTLINEETGETTVTHEYVFEGIEGIQYCVPTIQETEEENSYIATMSDPAISDGHTSISVGDDENKTSIDGTIFVTPSNKINTYYFNPVYQSADGSVYAVTGDGFTFSSDAYSEGSAYSQTMENTTSITENGKTKKDSISIKISISVMFAPEKIILLQMGFDNVIVSRTEYKPDEMPNKLTLEAGTGYLIVETHKTDNTGNMKVFREIYNGDADSIETFFVRSDGVCVKIGMKIMERIGEFLT